MKQFFKRLVVFVIQYEAKLVLAKYKPKIVVVVGSVGKTITKDAVYAVLSSSFFVRKSEKSYNSETGIPLAILGCPSGWSNPFLWVKNIFDGLVLIVLKNQYPQWLVLEIGADRPGDIKAISQWIKPDIVIVTRFPDVPVHVEFFDSAEALFEEKTSIISSLVRGGILIVNGDDEKVVGLIRTHEQVTSFTYGFDKSNNFVASHYGISYKNNIPTGLHFKMNREGSSVPIELKGVVGLQHVYAALAGIVVGASQGVNMIVMGESFANHVSPPGRMRILAGIKGTTIIDDSYNSSPVAVDEALSLMGQIKSAGKKIVVLGDMLELGKYSIDEHKRAGKAAAAVCDFFVTIGFRARHMAEGALVGGLSEKNILQYENAQRAGKELEVKLSEGDIILMKGSQGVRVEKTVEEIMAHPEQKRELLVRQDRAWLRR
ncbi:UDP-N-acetylmuramoyl-tripeptide--D-alanyl-D-alanine ligase [Patescibacteria group bacterium]|nr:UDP-N-acetylmuramoyl-tripeptide--D-alanyl-D-alanine ligase [Patescibacteria group bacterium]